MMRQTLGSSLKVFYSSRLKSLSLFSLFTEDVLNCIFFRTEGLFVGIFSCHNSIHCCCVLRCFLEKAVAYQWMHHRVHR